jgi:1-deoxy-D-xylulose-5-phosphate synthase
MGLLEQINSPHDLRRLDDRQLDDLAHEIRDFLIDKVSQTGGHLGPNLGVVELTLAIHRVFDSPQDTILFDTGHQSYVHKIVTGRTAGFDRLKKSGGLSGYPSRAESPHDVIENSHASTALSYADGLAKAYALNRTERHVVAVVGDGALTGGMAWEALNNIAAGADRRLVIVVNDNGRSYTPTVGGLATHLASLRTNPRYEQALELVTNRLTRTRVVGPPVYEALHAIKKGLKDAVAPQGLFEDLGLKYVGPIDGHDRAAVENALSQAKGFGGPVIVHTITQKGRGYPIAEQHMEDNFHSPAAFDPETGLLKSPAAKSWTDVFSDEMVSIGTDREDVVAITAAMLYPTGLHAFASRFPERTFDVGIAEQHAVTSAAGLAMGGMHPVVAVYATFLNRAFDQVLLDVALHRCGVTFVLDRAGVTGDDGPSHNGMWDLSILQVVPGLRIAAPRDGSRLRELLRDAVQIEESPTVVRFCKGPVPEDLPAVRRVGLADILLESPHRDVLLVAVGSMAHSAVAAAGELASQGVGATVVDPRWVKPVDAALVDLARDYRLVVSVEDNVRSGGVGVALTLAMREAGVQTPIEVCGIPANFLEHGKRAAILQELRLSGPELAFDIVAALDAISALDDLHREMRPTPTGSEVRDEG